MKTWAGLALTALLLSSPALAQQTVPPEQYHLRIEYWRWRPGLAATVESGSGGEAGTAFDPRQDLGIPDKQTTAFGGAIRLSPGFKLRGSYTRIDYAGQAAVPRTIRFGSSTFAQGDPVASSVTGGYYTGEIELDLVRRPDGYLGLLAGGKMFDVDYSAIAAGSGAREAGSRNLALPVAGAAGRIYFGRMSLAGELSGMAFKTGRHVYELAGSVALHLSDRLAVTGGYRYLSLRWTVEPDSIDLTLKGWRYGVQISL